MIQLPVNYEFGKSKNPRLSRSLMIKNFSTNDIFQNYNVNIKVYPNGDLVIKEYDKMLKYKKDGFEKVYDSKVSLGHKPKMPPNTNNQPQKIRNDNLCRSRQNLIDYAICNKDKFKSFITLTYAENMGIVEKGNKDLANWLRALKLNLKKDNQELYYLCVPEFQKRGAIHYHMVTSLECDSKFIPKQPLKKLYNPSTKIWREIEYYNLAYWKHGYSSAFDIINNTDNNFNIALYMCKYMFKDIDTRLFGRKKILKSNNLEKPQELKLMNDEQYIKALEFISENYDIDIKKITPCSDYGVSFTKLNCKLKNENL